MGNLRSVAKALAHVAPERAIVVTADPAAIRARRPRRASRPGRDARLHARARRERPARVGARGGARPARSSASASACRCCSTTARRAPTPAWACCPAASCAFRDEAMIDRRRRRLKVPHMGWNPVRQRRAHPLWHGIADGTRFYFVHSYYPVPGAAGADARRPPTIRRRLPARLPAIISLPCSSIPRKVTSPVSSCSPTSSPGTDAPSDIAHRRHGSDA